MFPFSAFDFLDEWEIVSKVKQTVIASSLGCLLSLLKVEKIGEKISFSEVATKTCSKKQFAL